VPPELGELDDDDDNDGEDDDDDDDDDGVDPGWTFIGDDNRTPVVGCSNLVLVEDVDDSEVRC